MGSCVKVVPLSSHAVGAATAHLLIYNEGPHGVRPDHHYTGKQAGSRKLQMQTWGIPDPTSVRPIPPICSDLDEPSDVYGHGAEHGNSFLQAALHDGFGSVRLSLMRRDVGRAEV